MTTNATPAPGIGACTDDASCDGGNSPPDIARALHARGFAPIPVPYREKNPNFPEWEKLILTEASIPEYFKGHPQNIGVLNGKPSGDTVDVDLDCIEAIRVAPHILPPTGMIHGRASKPRSHYRYRCPCMKTVKKYTDPVPTPTGETDANGKTKTKQQRLVEILSDGTQTVMPGSTHESGEPIAWYMNGEPATVDAAMLGDCVAYLASVVLVARHWHPGHRHDPALALAGALLRHGYTPEDAKQFMQFVCIAADDDDAADRFKAVDSTAAKLQAGESVTGIPTLREALGANVVDALVKWLKLDDAGAGDVTETAGKLTFTRLDDLLDEPEEAVSYVWYDTLPAGGLSLLVAKPKTGKSTFARNLLVAVARGEKCLGRETTAGSVLYCALEEKRSEVRAHFRQLDARGLPIHVHIGSVSGDFFSQIAARVREFHPALVIVDPVAFATKIADFNDFGAVMKAMKPYNELARETGAHIMLVHHAGKAKRDDVADATLGSTAFYAVVDALLVMHRKQDGARSLESRQRYGQDFPETVIEMDGQGGVLGGTNLTAQRMQRAEDEVVEVFKHNGMTPLTRDEIKAAALGEDKVEISNAVTRMHKRGVLKREGRGVKGAPYRFIHTPWLIKIAPNDSQT